ncbi:hypothetical protein KFE98_01445 [bacterium SCSIO 12741]|nr:hypothetical protein KFE98_01445 [bacterium SCSIO 12741]
MNAIIDLETLEIGDGRNPFNEIMAKVERLSLEGSLKGNKEEIEKTILFIERKYQDFSEKDASKSKVIYQAISASLTIFEKDGSQIKNSLNEDIKSIKNLVLNLSSKEHINLSSLLLSNHLNYNNVDKKTFTTEALKIAYHKVLSSIEEPENETLEWIFELNFDVDINERHKPLEFIHLFIESLNTIEGVRITLEDIKIGSIKVKLKAVFDDVSSKDEVKEILNSTVKAAKDKLEKDFNESEKFRTEATKNQVDTNIRKEELLEKQSPEYKKIKQYEQESLKLDVERKYIENQERKLDYFIKRKNLLRELISEGLIDQKDFEMLINGISLFKLMDGRLTLGEDIDIIDGL